MIKRLDFKQLFHLAFMFFLVYQVYIKAAKYDVQCDSFRPQPVYTASESMIRKMSFKSGRKLRLGRSQNPLLSIGSGHRKLSGWLP